MDNIIEELITHINKYTVLHSTKKKSKVNSPISTDFCSGALRVLYSNDLYGYLYRI